MPFGLCNAPTTFQRMMDEVLADMDWQAGQGYIDDVICGSDSFEDHLKDMQKLFDRLIEWELSAKLSKCHFFKVKLDYLGHEISYEGIHPNQQKIEAIVKMLPPIDIAGVRRFLGMTSYYRKFIRNYAQVAEPLYKHVRKGLLSKWDEESDNAFNELKERLIKSPILRYPDYSKEFIIQTDASDFALGGVLTQKDELNREYVVAYASRTLNKSERKYSPTERECLAVVWSVDQFRVHLGLKPFTIYTDHNPLKWLFDKKELTGKFARWALKLQEFDCNVQYRPGVKNGNADGLSRIDEFGRIRKISSDKIFRVKNIIDEIEPTHIMQLGSTDSFNYMFENKIDKVWNRISRDLLFKIVEKPELNIELPKVKVRWIEEDKNLRDEQMKDDKCHKLIEYLENGILPNDINEKSEIMMESASYEVVNGLLYKKVFNKKKLGDTELRLVIPESMYVQVLQAHHDSMMAGHLGLKKTYGKLASRYWWSGMYKTTREYIRNCEDCVMRKGNPQKNLGLPMSTVSKRPWHILGADILGPLPKTDRGNIYILVVIDHFTKWVEAFALPDQKAETIATKLIDEVFSCFGMPENLLTDRGKNFIGELLTWMEKKLDIKQLRTSSLHPQTNSVVERFNKTIVTIISMYVSSNQKDWDVFIPGALFAYRTSIHPSNGYSPFFMMFGREAREPSQLQELIELSEEEGKSEPIQYAKQLVETLQKAYIDAKQCEDKARSDREEYLLKKRIDHDFKVGDSVYLYLKRKVKGKTHKFMYPWLGPYKIVKFITPVTVILQSKSKKKLRQPVHVSRLKHSPNQINEKGEKNKKEEIKVSPDKMEMDVEDDMTDDENDYEVREVIGIRTTKKRGVEYRVLWKGFHEEDATWEPKENLENAQELVEEFHKKNGLYCEECGFLAIAKSGLLTHMKIHRQLTEGLSKRL